ncbi:MAG: N-acetyltransferase family protein [Pseudomonadota bacterium]
MEYSIVPAKIDHVPGVTAIYREAVLHHTASFELDPPDAAQIEHRMMSITERGYPYLVALGSDGSLLGYAYASAYRSRPAYRWSVENSVYVDPLAHGLGIGTALTRDIINRCEALGFRQMIAIVGGADNLASIAMHEKLGFTRAGHLPGTGFKHGKWLESVLLQRPLGEGSSTDPDVSAFPGNLYP